MKNFLFLVILYCGVLCMLASCGKDDDNPVSEPEINRFVLFGKTYPAFTVIVSKEKLGEGNYDIYVCPAEDNTIVLGLECSMQHDGMSLDLTKYDPLNAVPGYSGWCGIFMSKKQKKEKKKISWRVGVSMIPYWEYWEWQATSCISKV